MLRKELAAAVQVMRRDCVQRFQASIPKLWQEKPGVLYSWLQGDTPAWGSAPILMADGVQCITVKEVDAAVQAFWVDRVWRENARTDEEACWWRFQLSPFFPFISRCTFPSCLESRTSAACSSVPSRELSGGGTS